MYLSLHTHSSKSIGDGILNIDDYIAKAKEMGLQSLALTNHGTMSDIFEFNSKCIANDIKPILGCEIYLTEDIEDKDRAKIYHLILLAKNSVGFTNLIKIHNEAQLEGYYYKPRADFETLRKYNEGIICLSACVGGIIPQKILQAYKAIGIEQEKLSQEVYDLIAEFKSIYKDDFYLEIQPGDFSDQIVVNNCLIELAGETNTELLITNDVHYLNPSDYIAHNVHVASNMKKKDADELIYPDTCYYMMSESELIDICTNINKDVVKRCLVNLDKVNNKIENNIVELSGDKIFMPEIDVPRGYTEHSYLEFLAYKRLEEIEYKLEDPAEYSERLRYELDTIKTLNFSGYFLVVRDYILWAMSQGIPVGPGRGSICGSLTAWLVDITSVDPIRFNLLFERFLSVHRPSPPDVDTDFEASRRNEVFTYVVNKYGKDHCALVSTFAMRKAKSAVKDTGRAYGIDPELFEEAASLIPQVYYSEDDDTGESVKETDLSVEETINLVPKFKEIALAHPEWMDAAKKLTDIPKASSIHAAGTLISPISLVDKIPLIRSKNDDIFATALNLSDAESVGMIKFDFLSISTLTVLDKVCKAVNLNINSIDDAYNDEATWKVIGSKNTIGLFQIGTPTYRQRMGRLKPKTIEELAACLALVRGPCIASKADEKYMNIIAGKEEVELMHPIYDEVTRGTYGILLYQEQFMQIFEKMGFPLHIGYDAMKAAAKGKMDKLASYEKEFLAKAPLVDMDEETAKKIFKILKDTGLYSFNSSHAIAYAILVYKSAYLKAHYPKEYIVAALTNAYERKENIDNLVKEARRLGLKFSSPNINKPFWDMKLVDGNIQIGLCAIKSVSRNITVHLQELIRQKGTFCSMEDFLSRVSSSVVKKTAIVPLILTGAFSFISKDIIEPYKDFCKIRKENIDDLIYVQGVKNKLSIHDENKKIETALFETVLVSDDMNKFDKVGLENFDNYKEFYIVGKYDKIKAIKDKNGNAMCFFDLSTGDGLIECTAFKDTYATYKSLIKKNKICRFKLQKRNGSYILKGIEAYKD